MAKLLKKVTVKNLKEGVNAKGPFIKPTRPQDIEAAEEMGLTVVTRVVQEMAGQEQQLICARGSLGPASFGTSARARQTLLDLNLRADRMLQGVSAA